MLKGVLTGSILLLLTSEELYGYRLSERLASFGFEAISNGTIYPLLLSLEKKNLIVGKMKTSESGPKRKYYAITEEGLIEKERFLHQWQQLNQSMEKIIEGTKKNGKAD